MSNVHKYMYTCNKIIQKKNSGFHIRKNSDIHPVSLKSPYPYTKEKMDVTCTQVYVCMQQNYPAKNCGSQVVLLEHQLPLREEEEEEVK